MKYDYMIVGAGLYGAVFTHEMIKRGKNCLVINGTISRGMSIAGSRAASVCINTGLTSSTPVTGKFGTM